MTSIALAAVVGAVALPQTATAGTQCTTGEFCLFYGPDPWNSSGMWTTERSDADLSDNRFENLPTQTVANNSMSFFNNGRSSLGPSHVRLFTGAHYQGAYTCAPQGSGGAFRYDPVRDVLWSNNVESFSWRYSC